MGQRTPLEPAIALVVAVGYLALAYFDGGTDPQFRAVAAIGLWLAVILGLVLGLWPRAPIPRPALVAGMCLGGLAALAALSVTWSSNDEDTFIAVVRVLAYLGLFVAVVLASSAGGARPWLVGLTAGLGAVAVVAIVSGLQPGLVPAAETLREGVQPTRSRLSFPTGYWNGLGTCMALGITLFTWLAVEARRRLARSAATALIPVALLVLLLTSSRGAVIALGVGLAVLLVFGRPRRALAGSAGLGLAGGVVLLLLAGRFAREVVVGDVETAAGERQGDVLLLLSALVAAGVGALRFFAGPFAARVRAPRWAGRAAVIAAVALAALLFVAASARGLTADAASWAVDRVQGVCELPEGGGVVAHLGSASGSGRCQYWEVGIEAFASAPLGGIGAGGFEGRWAEHHEFPRPVSFAHSIFVTELAELGIGGLALIVGFLGIAAVAGLRARAGPGAASARAAALALLAAGTFSAAIDWMWEFPAVFAVVVVACAVLTGPALSPLEPRRRSRFGFGVAALVAGWVTIVGALLAFFGEAQISNSEEALEQGQLRRTVDAADTASTLQPWTAEPHLLKAAALEAEGDLTGAREAAAEAVDRAPSDYRAWAVAARIEMKSGDVAAGLELLERANALNPVVKPLSPEAR